MASFTVTLRLDDGAIFDLVRSQNGPVGLDLLRRGNRVQSAGRRNAPHDTGRLAGSITLRPGSDGRGLFVRIGSDLPYALAQEKGTGPILPVNGQFLRWPAKGVGGNRRYSGGSTSAYVYARRTRGVPAKHYLRDALEAAR